MGPNGLNLSVTMFSAKAVCSQGLASLCLFFPLPLAGEHRPPPAAVLRKERRSEASAMAPLRGGWGVYPRVRVRGESPHPGPPPQAGEGQERGPHREIEARAAPPGITGWGHLRPWPFLLTLSAAGRSGRDAGGLFDDGKAHAGLVAVLFREHAPGDLSLLPGLERALHLGGAF